MVEILCTFIHLLLVLSDNNEVSFCELIVLLLCVNFGPFICVFIFNPCHIFVLMCEEKKLTCEKKCLYEENLFLVSLWIMYCSKNKNFDFVQLGWLCKWLQVLKVFEFFLFSYGYNLFLCSSYFEFSAKTKNEWSEYFVHILLDLFGLVHFVEVKAFYDVELYHIKTF
jgi:hypothetical protein